MWTTYLPNSEVSWVEYDGTCAEVYRETHRAARWGQGVRWRPSKRDILETPSLATRRDGSIDVIIDDGEGRDSMAPYMHAA